MRKILPVLVALGMMMPAAVQAQSLDGTVAASATILAVLQVSTVTNLDFGDIDAGSGATMTPGVAPAQGTLGVLQMDHNSPVNVSVALPTGGLTLVGGSGTEPLLPVAFECGYSTAASGALDGSAVVCTALANRAAAGTGATVTSYIQVGGAITSANTTGRIPGTYTGDLVFTVTSVY